MAHAVTSSIKCADIVRCRRVQRGARICARARKLWLLWYLLLAEMLLLLSQPRVLRRSPWILVWTCARRTVWAQWALFWWVAGLLLLRVLRLDTARRWIVLLLCMFSRRCELGRWLSAAWWRGVVLLLVRGRRGGWGRVGLAPWRRRIVLLLALLWLLLAYMVISSLLGRRGIVVSTWWRASLES